MKKNLTPPLILFFCLSAFSTPAELTTAVGLSVPVDTDNRMVRDISTVKYSNGLRLNLGKTLMAGNAKFSSTRMIDFTDRTFSEYILDHEYTYGIERKEKFGILSFEGLAGTLRYSNGISRLKNPTFTCPPPLKTGSLLTPGITPSLPSSSSGKTPFSGAVVLAPEKSGTILPSMQLAILETGEKYGAIYKKIETPMIHEILFSCTGGTFFHEYSKESGWFQDERYYKKSEYFSGEITMSLMARNFRTSSSFGLYENPFGGTRRFYRNQSFASLGFFTLGLYYFDADEDIITASGKRPRTGRQIFLSPQIRINAGNGVFAMGSSFGETCRKSRKRTVRPVYLYNMNLGLSYTSMRISLKGNCAIEHSTETMKQSTNYGINGTVPFSNMSSTTAFNLSVDENESRKYRIQEKIAFRKKAIENVGVTWSWTEGFSSDKWNLDAEACFSRKSRWIKLNGKLKLTFRKLS